ncbi:MAG: M1 family metallopeptidase [Bacteroidetes bacterium]|nr:M1 family metallopeptidase [Bacteroidota bacterium]
MCNKFVILYIFFISSITAQTITKEDTLLGSNTVYRNWWNVTYYDISVKPNFNEKSISGYNRITYQVIKDSVNNVMQIDLQQPLSIDSIYLNNQKLNRYTQQGNRCILSLDNQVLHSTHTLTVYYHGKPKVAINPPWNGGWVWKKDSLQNPWMSVACQGAGASIWFPCKDIQSEEPDNGVTLSIIVPDSLVAIANGKLTQKQKIDNNFTQYTWQVTYPINSYNIIPYIGKYVLLHDSINGESGTLITDYWVLNYHQAKIATHLKPNVTKTIKCFEHWFGPYPFYKDSYKIVEAPYLGMEHQSNVAYGNFYLNGYAGRDLSGSGWGLKWDFIVVHESGHEWFGNNITARDVADNWVHEGFTSYSEVLFTDCEFGTQAGNEYCQGVRKAILNDKPIIGKYDIKEEGSGDMYYKGSQMIHMIRQMINDDERFRKLLRDINRTYYHQIVSGNEIELFIEKESGLNLKSFFQQYLRTTQIPHLEYKLYKNEFQYRFTNCINNFSIPIKIIVDKERWITPTTQWQTISLEKSVKTVSLDKNFYITLKP